MPFTLGANLSLIVISHNSCAITLECLARVIASYPEVELVVVDTGSSDGSPEAIAEQFPGVRVLRVPNRGYPFAVNRGLEVARGQYLVEMNSDVFLAPGDLEAIIEPLADPTVAMSGPTLINSEGRVQGFGLFSRPPSNHPRPRSWISGALIALRRETLAKIGGMDQRFVFYNDDLEWGFRARRLGYRVVQVPRRVIHLGGASTPNDPRFLAEGYRGGMLVSREYYPKLHGAHRRLVGLEAALRLRLDPDPSRREAYRLIAQMAHSGELDKSPLVLG